MALRKPIKRPLSPPKIPLTVNCRGGDLDAHIADTSNPHSVTLTQTGGTTDHTALTNKGTNTHPQIDLHISSTANPHSVTLAQTGGTTDHTALTNIGTNTHPQIDLHISSTANPHSVTLGQVGGSLDHTALSNIGTNTHGQIDSFIASKAVAGGLASLDGAGLVPVSQLPVSGLNYKGCWDASTNTPALSNLGGGGVDGDFYVVDVAGTTSIDGHAVWNIGDWIINVDGILWDRIACSATVSSVNTKIGAVVLTLADVGGTLDHTGLTNIGTNTHPQIDAKLAVLTNNGSITKEPTGFTDPENITVTYDSSTRRVTLAGTFQMYYQGALILDVTASTWVSDAHSAGPTTPLYLYYDGAAFVWATSSWEFSDAQIAYVVYDTGGVYQFTQRECHGYMPWQTHYELHNTIGTYKVSGGALSAYSIGSAVAANRRPNVSITYVQDEDLTTNNAILTSKLYTQYYLSGTGATMNYTVGSADIIPVSGAQPYYNQFTGGAWKQTLVTNNHYMNVWLVAIPAAGDTTSQGKRYLWIQGQTTSLTLPTIEALIPQNVTLGELQDFASEMVFIAKVIIRYQSGDWKITSVTNLTGTRASQVGAPAGNYVASQVINDSTVTGTTVKNALETLDAKSGVSRIDIAPWAWTTQGQGTWIPQAAPSAFSGMVFNTSATNGDNLSYDVFLTEGTYSIAVQTSTYPNRGIFQVLVDAVEVASWDTYSAGTVVWNVIKTQSGIAIATPGFKTLKINVNGHNVSASGYVLTIHGIQIWRTA